jgi:hypothetical protein
VRAVMPSPPKRPLLRAGGAEHGHEELKPTAGLVRPVREVAGVSGHGTVTIIDGGS